MSFLCTLLIIYAKAFKNLIFLKVILCQKRKTGPKNDFFFCLRSSVPVLILVSLKKIFLEMIFLNNFLSEKYFFEAFLSNPFDNTYQNHSKNVFQENKSPKPKQLLGKLFFFQYWRSVLPLITILSKFFFEKTPN